MGSDVVGRYSGAQATSVNPAWQHRTAVLARFDRIIDGQNHESILFSMILPAHDSVSASVCMVFAASAKGLTES